MVAQLLRIPASLKGETYWNVISYLFGFFVCFWGFFLFFLSPSCLKQVKAGPLNLRPSLRCSLRAPPGRLVFQHHNDPFCCHAHAHTNEHRVNFCCCRVEAQGSYCTSAWFRTCMCRRRLLRKQNKQSCASKQNRSRFTVCWFNSSPKGYFTRWLDVSGLTHIKKQKLGGGGY